MSLQNILLLSFGAAFGAVTRHWLGVIVLKHNRHNFPLGTLLINTSGAALLGIFCGFGVTGSPYVLLGDGFCGAFTTFSTFAVEGVQLIQGKAKRKALLFVVASIVFGVVGFLSGYFLNRIFA